MATFIPSITEDQAIDAIYTFLQPLCPGATILKSQQNRTAIPVGPFVELTPMRRSPLRTSSETLRPTGDFADITTGMQLDVQIDMYGPDSAQWAAVLLALWRHDYPSQVLNPLGLAPLTLTDAIQGPLTNSEMQYEDRWTLTLACQYNPVVTVPAQSANTLSMNIVEDLF